MGRVGEGKLQSLEGHCRGFGFYSKGDRYDEVSYGGPLICPALSRATAKATMDKAVALRRFTFHWEKQNRTKQTASMIESDRGRQQPQRSDFLSREHFCLSSEGASHRERSSVSG